MTNKTIIETERLILRPWQEEDLESFAQLNADSRVMEYFPQVLTKEQSDQLVKRFQSKIDENGWGLWAATLKDTGQFIGFIGLNPVVNLSHFSPTVEVGWRLAYEFWGKGYAPEGALACLKYGFEDLKLPEIVAFTASENERSMSVMKKIGMSHNPDDDFDHPILPEGHKLRRHVLYRIKSKDQLCQ